MIPVGDALPVDGVPPGTNLLVTGPAATEKRELALSLLLEGLARDDGVVYLSTTEPAAAVVPSFVPDGDELRTDQVAVVECGEPSITAHPQVRTDAATATDDLTSIAMSFSLALDRLDDARFEPVRVGFHSLSPVLLQTELTSSHRLLQVITRTVTKRGGLGVVTVDRPTDDEAVEQLRPQFSGLVETRVESDEQQCRLVGLDDGPSEWHTRDV